MALAEADLDLTQLANQDHSNRFHSDANLLVQFYQGTKKNQIRSAEEGRPIFEEIPYIRIMIPGNRSNVIDRPIRPQDKQRFAQYWKAYEAGQEQGLIGTPLSAWPALSKSEVEELNHFNIRTVEQLADLNDTEAQKFSGIIALKNKAQAFIDLANGTGGIDRLSEQLQVKDNEIATLNNAIEEMAVQIAELQKGTKKTTKA
jgi:hypothetical protein